MRGGRGGAVVVLLLGVSLAGCLADEEGPSVPAPPAVSAPPVTSFLHDLSPQRNDITVWNSIVEHYRTPVAGGVELDTWIIRPDVEEPVPIVLEVTPYYAGGDPRFLFDETPEQGRVVSRAVGGLTQQAVGTRVDPAHMTFFNGFTNTLLNRTYAVGISSVRGTGNSGGCFTQAGPQEALDTAAVISHMAGLSWSNGNVGLIGGSYPGTTPQDVWIEAPPALKTIVPIAGISDLYKYNFVNGVPIEVQGFAFNTYYWAFVGILPAGFVSGVPATDPAGMGLGVLGELCADQLTVQEGGMSSALDGNKDAYWQVRDFNRELRDAWQKNPQRASVFYIHGLQDWNVKPHNMEEWLDLVQDSGVPFKAWLGQWDHESPRREDWSNATLVAWFDQFLKGVDTGVLDAPPVQVQDDDGVWRHEERWPPVDVDPWVLHLGDDGALSDAASSGTARFHDQNGRVIEHHRVVEADPALYETAGRGPDRVVWRSDVLVENLTVSGLPLFAGKVTASGDRASLVLTLAEELPDGTLRHVNFAAQSLNHVADLSNGVDSVAGRAQDVSVRFFPQDDVLHAGSRIVLIAAGNTDRVGPGPALQPVADGSWIEIDLAGATLTLPIDRTLVVESPQPCWKGAALVAKGEREHACSWIR